VSLNIRNTILPIISSKFITFKTHVKEIVILKSVTKHQNHMTTTNYVHHIPSSRAGLGFQLKPLTLVNALRLVYATILARMLQ